MDDDLLNAMLDFEVTVASYLPMARVVFACAAAPLPRRSHAL